jgi:hypothetical protein
MEFGSDVEMQKLSREAREFFEKILYDEEPIFASDEATIFDVSTSSAEELSERCTNYYGKTVLPEDLKRPLWKLLRWLHAGRSGIAGQRGRG